MFVKRHMVTGFLLVVLALAVFGPAYSVFAQGTAEKTLVSAGPVQQLNNYFSTQTFVYSDGTSISRDMIKGPPTPPPGYEFERAEVALPEPNPEAGTNTLTVPAYKWVFGCSAVSGSMIAAYYDRNGFPNMYTGPSGGGMMPLTDDNGNAWGKWTDVHSDEYPNNPLIASHNGLEGRVTRGSIDDYWVQYFSYGEYADPYIGNWTQHTWGDAIGDYMKTSQSAYGNADGSTSFWSYNSSTQLTCANMETLTYQGHTLDTLDGTYGRKLFYEARGYTVTDCYSQRTDNQYAGGFSFAQYKAEIDAGRPVFLNLEGHSIVGVGYDDASNTVYIHDTWDNINHTMTWGGSYSGMQLRSVSIVHIEGGGSCTYTMSTSSKAFPANGGSTSVTVKGAGAATCAQPDLVPSDPWVTAAFTSAGWKKNKGTVKISAAKSTTSLERTGNVAIAEQTYSISQKPVICSITKLLPSSLSFLTVGGNGAFNMTLSAEDCAWTALASAGWIIPDGSGTGSATVNYTVGTNDTGKPRSGKVTVTLTSTGKTRPHTVRQQK